jgi:hypothetical protein
LLQIVPNNNNNIEDPYEIVRSAENESHKITTILPSSAEIPKYTITIQTPDQDDEPPSLHRTLFKDLSLEQPEEKEAPPAPQESCNNGSNQTLSSVGGLTAVESVKEESASEKEQRLNQENRERRESLNGNGEAVAAVVVVADSTQKKSNEQIHLSNLHIESPINDHKTQVHLFSSSSGSSSEQVEDYLLSPIIVRRAEVEDTTIIPDDLEDILNKHLLVSSTRIISLDVEPTNDTTTTTTPPTTVTIPPLLDVVDKTSTSTTNSSSSIHQKDAGTFQSLIAATLASSTNCTSPSSSIRTKFTTYETQSIIASGSPIISKYQKSDNQKYHSSVVAPTQAAGPLKSQQQQQHFYLPFFNQTSSSTNLSNLQKSVPINQNASSTNAKPGISGGFYSPLYSAALRSAVTSESPLTKLSPYRYPDYSSFGIGDEAKSSNQDFLSLSLSLSPPLNRKNREMPVIRGMISL